MQSILSFVTDSLISILLHFFILAHNQYTRLSCISFFYSFNLIALPTALLLSIRNISVRAVQAQFPRILLDYVFLRLCFHILSSASLISIPCFLFFDYFLPMFFRFLKYGLSPVTLYALIIMSFALMNSIKMADSTSPLSYETMTFLLFFVCPIRFIASHGWKECNNTDRLLGFLILLLVDASVCRNGVAVEFRRLWALIGKEEYNISEILFMCSLVTYIALLIVFSRRNKWEYSFVVNVMFFGLILQVLVYFMDYTTLPIWTYSEYYVRLHFIFSALYLLLGLIVCLLFSCEDANMSPRERFMRYRIRRGFYRASNQNTPEENQE